MSNKLPKFITFTGVDDATSIAEMRRLALVYPVEFGVLFSRSRQGQDPRYPKMDKAMALLTCGAKTAAHLCGEYARDIMNFEFAPYPLPLGLTAASRIQINHTEPSIAAAQRFSQAIGIRAILQTRDQTSFPAQYDVDWLYDRSGGRGEAQTRFPRDVYPYKRLIGYAGGLYKGNVLDAINSIGGLMGEPPPYWLDMESGVRTADNVFSIEMAWEVCATVYGDRRP